jgi:YaiO family outer membrane protein
MTTVPASVLMTLMMAQVSAPPAPPPAITPTGNPVIEIGVTRHDVRAEGVDHVGPWHLFSASVSWQPPWRVRPTFDVERQSRPGGSHERIGGGAYVDWTSRLYSYQAVSVARFVPEADRFYPRARGDVRVFWKTAETGGMTIAAGYTALSFGFGRQSQIVNAGAVLYASRAITQATIYLNRNQPGSLYSTAGSFAVQMGAEGRRWYGFSISGGRELYRIGTFAVPATADFKTATAGVFLRQWLTPRAGIHATAEYQRVMGSYSRVAATGRLFIGF